VQDANNFSIKNINLYDVKHLFYKC